MSELEKQIFDRLNQVADAIAPACERWNEIKLRFTENPSRENQQELEAACASLNELIQPYVGEIASATGNSESNIRSVGSPKGWGDVWFSTYASHLTPDQYLRNVAKYRSFSERYWADTYRAQRREALVAKVRYDTEVVDVPTAVQKIQSGEVAFIESKDFVRLYGNPSEFDKVALEAGLLKKYSTGPTQLSATADIGLVVVNGDIKRFVFWPEGVAVEHSEVKTQEIKPDVVRMTAAEADYEERRRPRCTPAEIEELLGTTELQPAQDPRVIWMAEASLGLSVPVVFHERFRDAGLKVSGNSFPRWRVALTDGLMRSLGEMVYGNAVASNLSRSYYLDMTRLNDGSYDLFVKYQSIIGSRRLGSVPDELVERLYQACEEALHQREQDAENARAPTPMRG